MAQEKNIQIGSVQKVQCPTTSRGSRIRIERRWGREDYHRNNNIKKNITYEINQKNNTHRSKYRKSSVSWLTFLWMLIDFLKRVYVSWCAYLGCLNYFENKNRFAATIPISCHCSLIRMLAMQ